MVIIEFIGMPRAGKSTQVKLLKKELEKRGSSVKVIADRTLMKKIKISPTEVIAYKIVFYSKVLEEFFKHKKRFDYIIIDRGFRDSKIWFEVENILGHIHSKRALELGKTFEEFSQKVHKTICMMVNPDEAFQRHLKTEHMEVDDVGTSKKYLAALRQAYCRNRRQLPHCLWIDQKNNPQKIHQKILKFILEN